MASDADKMSPMVRALLGLPPELPSFLPMTQNSLLGLGNAFAPAVPVAIQPIVPQAPTPSRRVFFSFHYEQDVMRAGVVRNSHVVRPADERRIPFIDNSLWEKSKKQGDEPLMRLIRSGMSNSSITCVLAGESTWSRPWVRFEIAHSLFRKNGLLTVFIDGVQCAKAGGPSQRGPNPLDFMGLFHSQDGKNYVCEWDGTRWVEFARMPSPVTWPAWLPRPVEVRSPIALSEGTRSFDYAVHDGYSNLSTWIGAAATDAKK